jgi:hypothetical protein
MQEDLLYRLRESLKAGEENLPRDQIDTLKLSRQKAVQSAERRHGDSPVALSKPNFSLRFWPQFAGVGLTAATAVAVLVGLQASRIATIEEDISRIAEIDHKMISDRLPVQAYLDPGFLVFQEQNPERSEDSRNASTAAQSIATVREFWASDRIFQGFSASKALSWSRLTNPQREALAPLEPFWADLDDVRKKKWLKIADRFHQWTPEQQTVAQERMLEWISLPAIDRRQARAVFGGVVAAMPEEVRIMKWNEYQKLSAEERARLIELAQLKPDASSAGRPATGARDQERPAGQPRSALATQPAKPLAP